MIIWEGSAQEEGCVTLMVAGTDTTGCYMGIEMETTLSLDPWELSLKKLSLKEHGLREPSPSQPSFSWPGQFKEEGKSSQTEMTTFCHKELENKAAGLARRGMLTPIQLR